MKKMLVLIVVLLLTFSMTTIAFADEGEVQPAPIEFFSWTALLTYGGAVLMTTLVTQLLKGIGFIGRIPTRLFAYVIALIVLIAATYFSGGLTMDSAALCAVNAVVVALASSGAFDAVKQFSITNK